MRDTPPKILPGWGAFYMTSVEAGYFAVNFTAFVVTAGIHPATDASVDVVIV